MTAVTLVKSYTSLVPPAQRLQESTGQLSLTSRDISVVEIIQQPFTTAMINLILAYINVSVELPVDLSYIKQCISFIERGVDLDERFERTSIIDKIGRANAFVQQALGDYFYSEENSKEASVHYERALFIDPNVFIKYSNLGDVFFDIKEYEKAASYYLKALNQAKVELTFTNNSVEIRALETDATGVTQWNLTYWAATQYYLKKFDLATEILHYVMNMRPLPDVVKTTAYAFLTLIAYYESTDWNIIIDYANRAAKDIEGINLILAEYAYIIDEYWQALGHIQNELEEAKKLYYQGDKIKCFTTAAHIYHMIGDDVTAQIYLTAVLKKKRDFNTLLLQAVIFFDRSKYEDSFKTYVEAEKLSDVDLSAFKGQVRFHQAKFAEAVELLTIGAANFQVAETYGMKRAFLQNLLGAAYFELKKYQEAYVWFHETTRGIHHREAVIASAFLVHETMHRLRIHKLSDENITNLVAPLKQALRQIGTTTNIYKMYCVNTFVHMLTQIKLEHQKAKLKSPAVSQLE